MFDGRDNGDGALDFRLDGDGGRARACRFSADVDNVSAVGKEFFRMKESGVKRVV